MSFSQLKKKLGKYGSQLSSCLLFENYISRAGVRAGSFTHGFGDKAIIHSSQYDNSSKRVKMQTLNY